MKTNRNPSLELLTHSRQDCFKVCRKKHYYAYELGIRKINAAKALRIGTNGHAALETLGCGGSINDAMDVLDLAYSTPSDDSLSLDEWNYEHETLRQLIAGYVWRWPNVTHVATEQSFCLPLVNPATGKKSRTFELGGKIDGIIKLEDGRLAVLEHKFLGESLDSDSDIWKRLLIDHQVTLYLMAARQLGYDVDTVIYDVIRKPTIKPTEIPILDDDGIKVVLDRSGNRVLNKNGKPRQTASTKDGFCLQSRSMNCAEWGQKLNEDIGTRPEYYYARQEVPRLDGDIEEYCHELWDIAHAMRDAASNNRSYRTANKNTCSWCSYYGLCTTKFDTTSGELPEGFEVVKNLHPELEFNDAQPTTAAAWKSPAAGQSENNRPVESI